MTRFHITGSEGFVGQQLCQELHKQGFELTGSSRFPRQKSKWPIIKIDDIGPQTSWLQALSHVDVVFHLAARAHILKEEAQDPLAEYRRINSAGTLNLAKQAAQKGVQRFIFMSSIGVNGISTIERPFEEGQRPNPHSHYAVAKLEAEIGLKEIAAETGMEVVIVRAPLVYGPGVKGNFLRLLNLAAKGIPLPLGQVKNLRSMVSVYNLVDFILRCVEHPKAKGQTFLVSDGYDVSTPELIRMIAKAMGKKSWLPAVPLEVLKMAGLVTGKSAEVERLCSSLKIDIRKANEMLEWSPPVSVEEGIRRTVQWYQGR